MSTAAEISGMLLYGAVSMVMIFGVTVIVISLRRPASLTGDDVAL